MTVLSVHKKAGIKASINDKFEREYNEHYQVISDTMNETLANVSTATGIPLLWGLYNPVGEIDYGARVVNVDCQQNEDAPKVWDVEVTYRTSSADESQKRENPLERPPEVDGGYEVVEEVLRGAVKVTGNTAPTADDYISGPVKNSAGEPFDPPPTREVQITLFRATVNLPSFDPLTCQTLNNAVNSDTFLGLPARTVKVGISSFKRMFENGYAFWQVVYEFRYKESTWDLRLLNHGSYYIDGPGSKKDFTTEDGSRITGNLTSGGQKLADNADPVFLRFKAYAEYAFSSLGLSNLFT